MNQDAGPSFTLMLISFHSPSDGMKLSSKFTRVGSVGKKPLTFSLPSPSTAGGVVNAGCIAETMSMSMLFSLNSLNVSLSFSTVNC